MEKEMSNKIHIPDDNYVPAGHPWAGSGNYVADDDTLPREISFANGRVVNLRYDSMGDAYLHVTQRQYVPLSIPAPSDGELREAYAAIRDLTSHVRDIADSSDYSHKRKWAREALEKHAAAIGKAGKS